MGKYLLLMLIAISCGNLVQAQSGSGWEWASASGTTSSSPGIVSNDIATDASGNVFVVGRFYSTAMSIGPFSLSAATGSDIFIAKYHASGNVQWLKRHTPPTGYNEVSKVITTDTEGNIYIGGTDDTPTLSGRAFLAKYDTNGNMLWNKFYSLFEVGGVNIAADGNPVIMESNQTAKNILKVNKADGSIIWTVQNINAGSNSTSVYKDFMDQNGNIYYTCFTSAAATVSIAGESITTNGLASFIASVDANGQKRWVKTINNIQVVLGYTIDETGKSYIVFSGGGGDTFQGIQTTTLTNRYFELDQMGLVTKHSLVSPYAATRAMFRVRNNYVYGFYLDQGGTAHGASFGDYFYGIPATSTFALGIIVKYSISNEQVVWANAFEVNGSSYVSGSFDAIGFAGNGKILVAGSYGTSVKFGSANLTANGATYATDFYVAQFNGDQIAPPAMTKWTGAAADGNWSNASNWDNGVPDGTKKSVLPGGLTSYPNNIPANAQGGKLEVAVGAKVQLPLNFSAVGGIVNNGAIEINESTSGTFMGTFANNIKPTGSGKLVFKNDKTTIYLTQPLDQSIEINSAAPVSTYGGTINGDLVLTNGNLNFVVAIYPLTVNGNISGGSASGYVSGGVLNRKVTGLGNYVFPIGTADRYAPVNLKLDNVVGPQMIAASYAKNINGSSPNTNAGGQSVNALLNAGIWTITPDVALASGSYTITLEGRGYTNGVANAANYVVLKRANSSGAWGFFGANGTSTQVGGVVTATAGNINGFSDFAIGIAGGQVPVVLPVKLTTFTVKVTQSYINLNWQTLNELNNDKFVIERSVNGLDFIPVGEVNGNGTSGHVNHYAWQDRNPQPGNNYYRLKQLDLDGATEYSEVRLARFTVAEGKVQVFPNPASSYITLSMAGSAITKVDLVDISGRTVACFVHPSQKIALPSLANGTYMVIVNHADGTQTRHKIAVQN